MIGPDPEEWFEGIEDRRAIMRSQFSEMATLDAIGVDVDEIVAWKEGTVGWIAVRCRMTFGPTEPQEARLSIIVHEEGLYWKVVHSQFAFTVNNEDAVGLELTTTVDELLESVENELPSMYKGSPDGSVTIMFTDIEGSTVLMESLGEDRWFELLEWHDSIVKRNVATFGGSIVKGQGDGFMVAFPAPGSAVACAVAIQRSLSGGWAGVPVPARIGINAGNVKTDAGDFFGRTVVVAARIANSACGGEILVTQAIQESLNGVFVLDGPRTISLKGLAGTHPAFAIVWA
jgi:class 3 adenylate cyclase